MFKFHYNCLHLNTPTQTILYEELWLSFLLTAKSMMSFFRTHPLLDMTNYHLESYMYHTDNFSC